MARRPAPRGARPVGELVGRTLDPLLERKAGVTLDMLAMWEEFAGAANAACSRPERLDWPGRTPRGGQMEAAVLVVACDPARSLFITHEADAIAARINAYFGYRAVARIQIVQKPIAPTAQPRTPRRPLSGEPVLRDTIPLIESVEDDELRAALRRLGQGVFSRRSNGVG